MLTAFTCQDEVLRRTSEPLADAVWIDLLEPTPDETERVARETGLAVPTEADINEIESSSRLATRDGVLYLNLPVVIHLDGEPRSVSFGFVLSRDRLITVRFAASRVFEQFMAHHATPARSGSACDGGAAGGVVDRQADALEQVKADLETISHRIFAADMVAASGRKREDRCSAPHWSRSAGSATSSRISAKVRSVPGASYRTWRRRPRHGCRRNCTRDCRRCSATLHR